MSNATGILIEKLKLKLILRERVFIKWEDDSGTPCILGSRLRCNGQNLNFFIAIYYDEEGHLHIHFSLEVSVILGGTKQKIEILLVVPPDTNFSDTTNKPCLISNIENLSHLDASAIHDAEISDSMHVICLQFDLITKGFIITKKKKNTTTIKPRNYTSKGLIRGFESLSDTKTFTVYIKPNDYALVGLEEVRNRLSNTGTPTDIHKTNVKEIYVGQTPELVEWSRLYPVSLLPSYTKNPPQLSPEVQVPLSPPIIFEQDTPLINTIEAAIEETPPRFPTRSNSISVHGIFSGCEESSDSEVNLDDAEKHMRIDFDVDSDEEELAKEQFANNSRESNEQFDYDLEASQVSRMLSSKLEKWIETVLPINFNVHHHTRLVTKFSILGNCIRTSDADLFDITLLWCSALFFYDPLDSDSDSDNTSGLWEKRNSWLIRDIVEQIQWANKISYSTEISSALLEHFTKLGQAARIVALDAAYNKGAYFKQKSVFITYVLAEFGKPGRKPVSRKRLETDSSTSKRVKI
ncbi:hypothetical protein BCIN_10g04450 [Botrytis cinerea B05.10]|uniref:Uncharacterized protein n=2 Tax=Botryotinia fuckeliana TaxID=40559 RepID=A0A384JV92_BOTFB|nr:hypothetical protein BCIN_10g04450 [Botrytis cinerea B05.10]ATZ54442.1 hypothetical protein BCIN_10g04450 [Botrytis cinerea B05.10]CCD50979.1 hypothetical protein BofuT4_P022470.1 [Botrytis cinerea T4]